jgi:hypothetical protein
MLNNKMLITIGIIASIVFVVIGVIWLATSVETLDEVAEEFGAKESPLYEPPLPDYEIPGLEGNTAANILLGVVFTFVALGVTLVAGKALRSKR